MAHDLVRTFIDFLEVFRPALTRPSFAHLVVLMTGWVLTTGPHAVTAALVATRVSGRRHHEAFHRFFSRGSWDPDHLGHLLLSCVMGLLAQGAPLRLCIDDTLAPHKGAHVFGLGSHIDAVRSTKRCRIFSFGHCWVVLAVLMPMPFSKRTWALPLLFRLYRNKKSCDARRRTYRKKTELAREMMDVLLGWVGQRRVLLAADAAYCNDTVTKELPPWVVLLGAMRPDAVLTAPPQPHKRSRRGGRPSKRGQVLPKPVQLAQDDSISWRKVTANLYGRRQKVVYKNCFAQWYRACGTRLLHILVVQAETGSVGLRVFFSTDATMSVSELLEGYAGRWAIEVSFRELKQQLGFADSSARKEEAVLRTAPFVGLLYTVLVLWFADKVYQSSAAVPPERPWYGHKQGLCFADILRTAQRVLPPLDVLDPRRWLANLQKPLRAASQLTHFPENRAA